MASIIEKFIGPEITDEMISQAADLFSSNYGIWGIIAAERSGVKQGEASIHATIVPNRP
jgi:hypothetical protein